MNKKLRKVLLTLDILFIIGLIFYSAILLSINKTVNTAHILSNSETIHQRFFWRWLAERIFSLCTTVYVGGHIGALYFTVRKHISISFQMVCFYFLFQIGIMFLCITPFALFNLDDWGDYLFLLWSSIGVFFLLFLIFIITIICRKIRSYI